MALPVYRFAAGRLIAPWSTSIGKLAIRSATNPRFPRILLPGPAPGRDQQLLCWQGGKGPEGSV